ncbi:MAG: branched-chain amino acid ABC transporter permease [Thermoleophilaceae bacterium]
MNRFRNRWFAFVAFLLAGPLLVVATEVLTFLSGTNLVFIGFAALAATGLTLIMGFAGQVSLGHAAFYGVGAYTVALLTVKQGWAPFPAILAGVGVCAVLAALLGVAVLRIRGHFLAMATLAFGLIFFFYVRGAEYAGGNQGIGGIPPLTIGGWDISGEDESTFLFTWALLALGIVVAQNLVDSRTGRSLRALGASEVAASTSGIDVARAKVAVFVVGALYASVAGSLYAMYVSYINPDAFGVLVSLQFLVISTIGGLRSVWGAAAGAIFVVSLTELSREVVPLFFEEAAGSYEIVAYGIALVVVLLALRQGIVGGVRDLAARLGPTAGRVGGEPETYDVSR